MRLDDLLRYIESHGRLPGIPSEFAVRQSGVNLAATQVQLLAKVEELTLYLLDEHTSVPSDSGAAGGRSSGALDAPYGRP